MTTLTRTAEFYARTRSIRVQYPCSETNAASNSYIPPGVRQAHVTVGSQGTALGVAQTLFPAYYGVNIRDGASIVIGSY